MNISALTWFSEMKAMEKRWPNMVNNFESRIVNKETPGSGYMYVFNIFLEAICRNVKVYE